MNYLAIALNHFKVVQNWMSANGAEGELDIATFELEIRCRHRYFRLFPQFVAQKQGRFVYEPNLTSFSFGFIGWRPYRTINWPLSDDKLAFKNFMRNAGERTPAFWRDPSLAQQDYVLKRSRGSFGDDLAGPFRTAVIPDTKQFISTDSKGVAFAEQFIHGEILKVWYWGDREIYAQRKTYPEIKGDGVSSIRVLVNELLALSGKHLDSEDPDYPTLLTSLSYQGLELDSIPSVNTRIWLDYRYGRSYVRTGLRTAADNALPDMSASLMEQIVRAGAILSKDLNKQLGAPVLFSLDAVIDKDERIWWLEMNSNPTLPPDGYPFIFASLFGTQTPARTEKSLAPALLVA